MNDELDRLAREVALDAAGQEPLRLAFGHACVLRVRHLLEDPAVVDCLDAFTAWLGRDPDDAALAGLARRAAALATSHPGSKSIDGCGHAAVSATFAVAQALAGRARPAAEYAAYATVYAQGGSGAVADRESFRAEFRWQVDTLRALARAPVDSATARSS